MNIHDKLVHAVTDYDRKQLQRHLRNPRRSYHNPHALPQYLAAVEKVDAAIIAGRSLREAVVSNFCGRLLDVCLRTVGEPISTDSEQRI